MTRGAPIATASSALQHSAATPNRTTDVNEDSHAGNELELDFPAFYAFGLLGYCQGQERTSTFSNCSDPSIRFSFDELFKVLRSTSKEIDFRLPDHVDKALAGYCELIRWFILLYLVGAVAAVLTVTFDVGSMMFSWRISFIPFTFALVSCNLNSSDLAETKKA